MSLGGSSGRRIARPASWSQQSFLGALPCGAQAELLTLGTQREFAAGRMMIMEGDAGTDIFLLIDGWVKVSGLSAEGGRVLLSLCYSGDLVGEEAALDGLARPVSVVAAGPTVAQVVSRDNFLKFLNDFPGAFLALGRALSAKLRWATNRRVDSSCLPVEARLARVLSELAQLDLAPAGPGIGLGCTLTQPELAEMIGASEPSVQKALRQLRDRGLITTGYRKILIHDLPALRAVTDSAWLAAPGRAEPARLTKTA